MKKYLFLLIALFPIVSGAQPKVSAAEKYIARYHQLAIVEMELTGIPASITLAQALHESANGTSLLAVKANNHFGVRCSSNWAGKRFYRNGNKKNRCFRKYNSAEEAYKDRSSFLTNNKKYALLFKYGKQDYKNWAKGLQRSGYASSRTYAKQLISTIKRYNLQEFDKPKTGITKKDSL